MGVLVLRPGWRVRSPALDGPLVVPATGALAWWKADAGVYTDAAKTTPATLAGDLVYTWADQTGNGHDLVQATSGSRPLYEPTDGPTSGPAIRFSQKTISATFAQTNPDVYILFRNVTWAANSFLFGDASGTKWGLNDSGLNPSPGVVYWNGAAATQDPSSVTLSTWWVLNIRVGAAGSGGGVYLNNGAALISTTSSSNSTAFVVGDTGHVMRLDAVEILIYDPLLAATPRTATLNYLAMRGGGLF